ncbi:hypothetical protein GCM10009624_31420 [Gordonia sinesedis]
MTTEASARPRSGTERPDRPGRSRDARTPAAQYLADARRPGRDDLRAAAGWRVAAVAAMVLWWEGVAALIAGGTLAVWLPVSVAAILGGAGCTRAAGARAVRAHRRIATAIRDRILRAATHNRRPVGAADIAQGTVELAADIAAYHRTAGPATLAAAPSCVVVLGVVAWQHWPVAVLLALTTPFIPGNMRLAGLATQDAERRQLDDLRRLSALFLDRFAALRTIRSLGALDREADTIHAAAARVNHSTMRVLRRAFVSAAVLDTIVTFAIAIAATYVGLTLLGYVDLPGTGQLRLSTGLAVLLLVPLYYEPLRAVAGGYHERDRAQAAAELLTADEAASDSATADPALARPLTAAPAVEVRNLTVAHGDRLVLDGISAHAPPGSLIAVTGPSGAGKTTLLSCVAGLRDPDGGDIDWVGGRPSVHGGATRQTPVPGAASWIGQRTVILAGSLADNIALGDPSADRDALTRAAHAAGLGPLLARLPRGLDEHVGDDGWGLSAGESRRVALARAVVRDSMLWLLDEPTAHLDAVTEREVLANMVTAAAGRTVIVATHSAAVMRWASEIWHIRDGVLTVEDGDLA